MVSQQDGEGWISRRPNHPYRVRGLTRSQRAPQAYSPVPGIVLIPSVELVGLEGIPIQFGLVRLNKNCPDVV